MDAGSETEVRNVKVSFLRTPVWLKVISLVSWATYLGSAAFLLRPVLLTAIAADDLINPFSQMYHAGTGINEIFSRAWNSVSSTGHFNYVGQLFGSYIVALWNYLIGNFGIRYSSVYAMTKFVVYLLTIEVSARLLRELIKTFKVVSQTWNLRIALLLLLALSIQIHIPWSNDPVASYPLSGFLAVVIGLLYIYLVFRIFEKSTYLRASVTGIFGALAVLYYEFNLFAVLSVTVILAHWLWLHRGDKRALIRATTLSALVVFPGLATTAFFYLKNKAASANYTGTSVSFDTPFPKTFLQGIIGSLPAGGWNMSFSWLPNSLSFNSSYIIQFIIGIGLVSLTYFSRPIRQTIHHKKNVTIFRVFVYISPLLIYWAGATMVQASTIKVQQEAIRIGQVYNYYAVGVVCLAIIVACLFSLIDWRKIRLSLKVFLVAVVLTSGAFQYVINWNITNQFNMALSGNRNLLVAFADKPPMVQRCAAFEAWKAMGWPEYYWLDMELGMNATYLKFHGQEFCRK
jgi:hypothetical protein